MSNHLQNQLQKPIFAPQNSQVTGDDIDLNEIFADYFINEYDDPLNAYTSSMANYSGAAAAIALAQKQQQVAAATQAATAVPQASAGQASLPTGGIKTPWHTGATAVPSIRNGTAGHQQLSTIPPAKKAKVEDTAVQGKGALSGRLGFSMVGGQLSMPQRGAATEQQPAINASAPSSVGDVSLPVGVGIRLGGVGGVAPVTAQTATTAGGTVPGQYNMWGGMTGGAQGANASEHAVAERRQRNREHAKRSRVRKKFMLESLQEQVRGLQKENKELRMIVQQNIPQHAQQIISEICSENPLFTDEQSADTTSAEKKTDAEKEKSLVRSDFSLISSLTSGQQNFVLSDPRLPDNPIVYASEGFYELTGYTREQVLGRNCRFLQGPQTDPRSVDIIRTAIANGSDATTCILNYKADGTPFWNQFFVAALRDSDNCIVNYVGVQCEIHPEAGASALEDKVNQAHPLQEKSEEKEGDDETKK